MRSPKLFYRIKQFALAIISKPSQEDCDYAGKYLNSDQFSLFEKLQNSEQSHAIAVCKLAEEQGEHTPDLYTAALLHDIGKIRYPIRLWERVFFVLASPFLKDSFKKKERQAGKGLFRIFRISEEHPAWGAELAEQAGASKFVVSLIRRHQDNLESKPENKEDNLLEILQYCDNNN